MTPVQTWIAALGTLAIFSLVLYKDNKVFRLTEGLLVGVTAAHGIVLTYHNYLKPTVTVDIVRDGKWVYALPLLLGLLIYTRFARPVAWLARFPMALWLGVGSGYIITRQPAMVITQAQASFMSLNTVNNVIFVVGVLTSISYFYFTVVSTNQIYGGVNRLGRVFLLVAFGASFANTVMARISLLLGRVQFLLQGWLKIAG